MCTDPCVLCAQKPHFRFLGKNISQDTIDAGVAKWSVAALSIEDGKTSLSKTSLFKHAHAHKVQHEAVLANADLLETLTSMMNSGTYLPSVAFLSGPGGVLRLDACQTIWRNLNGAKNLKEHEVRSVFFGAGAKYVPYRNQPGGRYFDDDVEEVAEDSPVQVSEGFLTEQNTPLPPATREGLSNFVRGMTNNEAASSSTHAHGGGSSSEALRPDSPRSAEGNPTPSDDEFIDDGDSEAAPDSDDSDDD